MHGGYQCIVIVPRGKSDCALQSIFPACECETGDDGGGKELCVLDMAVFNMNRDHPSAMELSAEDGEKVRHLFACLIEIVRAKECIMLAKECSVLGDVEAYMQLQERVKSNRCTCLRNLSSPLHRVEKYGRVIYMKTMLNIQDHSSQSLTSMMQA